MSFQEIQNLFPSQDGSPERREEILSLISKLLSNIDDMKDVNRSVLGTGSERDHNFYKHIIDAEAIPQQGKGLEAVISTLSDLAQSHPYQTKNYLTNVIPLASIPGILGSLTTSLLNANGIWDIYSPGAAEAEVRAIAAMSKVVGYNPEISWGYTTWGGQGAVFTGLRLAIAKQFPKAKEEGIPNNLYCFASEGAHYSLLKSCEATGIGSNHLVVVKTKKDHSMDTDDLLKKMREVVEKGGIPVYVVATTGTTDSFGIDNVKLVKMVTQYISKTYNLKPIHVHADSALGGFYAMFNHYDFVTNPLEFEPEVLNALHTIRERLQHISLADSVCFDFHKLGQCPYATSLFLLKNGKDFSLVDLDESDTPYMGNRGYGSYHTSYTLECSRAASSIAIVASLEAFGMEGYQRLLANYVRINLAFRKKIMERLPYVAITNNLNPGPVSTFRFYPNKAEWDTELNGKATSAHVERNNVWNNQIFELLGAHREEVFFGDTKKVCKVNVADSADMLPIYSCKFFSVSPYTQKEHVDFFIAYLEEKVQSLYEENQSFSKAVV
ncbi:pyridoxal phosphate-dependent decarboxylase family protein [Brevibacillus dissolubilis]|uniref:pyridoxal phosphate-dependent decarboxylase family protein n=1 Tax=Brevibacillus dissolubilis TaxID=1844116 RepID=UPI0011161D81|nr:pyridoxal-dependent decarboxylase [Brevibacillus dissolubilis]